MDFPLQQSSSASLHFSGGRGNFDMRNWLTPRRLTLLMWDQSFLMRHAPGEAYAECRLRPGAQQCVEPNQPV